MNENKFPQSAAVSFETYFHGILIKKRHDFTFTTQLVCIIINIFHNSTIIYF